MNKLWKYTQYGYLLAALILIIDGILQWNKSESKPYFSFIFATLFVVLFYFKNRFRKKIEDKNRQNN